MYQICFASGKTPMYFGSYGKATKWFCDEYPEAVVGHDGDLTEGGDRTLCWENEDDAENDAGQKAIASIYKEESDVDGD